MQALSGKEVEYIIDSMSNEELLLKQCAATASIACNTAVRDYCYSTIQTHEQHLHTLMNALQQAQTAAQQQFGGTQQNQQH